MFCRHIHINQNDSRLNFQTLNKMKPSIIGGIVAQCDKTVLPSTYCMLCIL